MICPKCQTSQHGECYDRVHETDYPSCFCLHRVKVVEAEVEPDDSES